MYTWALVGTLVLGAPALKVERKPIRPPMGDWTVEQCEADGLASDYSSSTQKQMVRITSAQFILVIGTRESSERVAWFRAGETLEADFEALKLDGDIVKDARKAIWKVDGDTFTICIGDPRPSEFTAPKKSNRFLFVFKRVKD